MLELELKEIKGLKTFKLSLPFKKGLYAITGENGIGKSTIFAILSKLVYRGALVHYLKNDGNAQSRITYRLNGNENIWEKPLGWKRVDGGDPEIFLDGFYEGSLIFGSRFSDAHTSRMVKTLNIKPEDIGDADTFVLIALGQILRNDPDFYLNLKRVKTKAIAKALGFSGIPYLIERGGKWVHQFNMSSGEFLLIGLLHFINERIKYKDKRQDFQLSLIMIDEIELALHPSAQDRLAIFLNKISIIYNFCIYFATHSVQIIANVLPEKIYHLDAGTSGNVEVINPCYPAYATRCLYTSDGFDFILLVEDDLAKAMIEKIVRNNDLQISRLIKILPCGGWEKTLELHREISSSRLAGTACKIISILDGDIRAEYDAKYAGTPTISSLTKTFLPIKSLEKCLRSRLFLEPESKFIKVMGDTFFNVRPLKDILNDYKANTVSDNNGKKLFMILKRCAEEQGYAPETFKRDLCHFILDHENFDALSSSLDTLCR